MGMERGVIGTLLEAAIVLMQFVVLIPLWGRLFGPDSFFNLSLTGFSGVVILIVLLAATVLYPEMPLRKAVRITALCVAAAIAWDILLFVWAYNNHAF